MENNKKKNKNKHNKNNKSNKNKSVNKQKVSSDIDELKKKETENIEFDNTQIKESEEIETKEIELDNTEIQNSETEDSDTKSVPNKKVSEEVRNSFLLGKEVTTLSSEHIRVMVLNALKILLPVAACAIVIAVIISYIGGNKNSKVEQVTLNVEENTNDGTSVTLTTQPLAENEYTDVNELMQKFYKALADGDMDTVRTLKDYTDDTGIITYEKKSEFIESYDNIVCYTKPGLDENSYFAYISYEAKIKDIDTKAPGLNAYYVYTSEDGTLKIDGNMEENIEAALKLVTSQDDVVDLYNKVDVNYKEAISSDEVLNSFMIELPEQIKISVGEALAQLQVENTQTEMSETESAATETETEISETTETTETEVTEQQPQNQTVNQTVRTTDTVNVRSSDSEQADKIGRAEVGTELTRIEERINGWSKVIFEDKEAYIKSDYLEVITTETVSETIGTVTATTNVNIRSKADQESEKLGTAQVESTYDLLEDQGEWYKISYDGKVGYVKAEYFEK